MFKSLFDKVQNVVVSTYLFLIIKIYAPVKNIFYSKLHVHFFEQDFKMNEIEGNKSLNLTLINIARPKMTINYKPFGHYSVANSTMDIEFTKEAFDLLFNPIFNTNEHCKIDSLFYKPLPRKIKISAEIVREKMDKHKLNIIDSDLSSMSE
jgi:hypothetical protein